MTSKILITVMLLSFCAFAIDSYSPPPNFHALQGNVAGTTKAAPKKIPMRKPASISKVTQKRVEIQTEQYDEMESLDESAPGASSVPDRFTGN